MALLRDTLGYIFDPKGNKTQAIRMYCRHLKGLVPKKITITKIELSSKETCKRSDLARQLANESALVEFAKGVEKNIVPCKKVISFENNAKPFCIFQNRSKATLPTWAS